MLAPAVSVGPVAGVALAPLEDVAVELGVDDCAALLDELVVVADVDVVGAEAALEPGVLVWHVASDAATQRICGCVLYSWMSAAERSVGTATVAICDVSLKVSRRPPCVVTRSVTWLALTAESKPR